MNKENCALNLVDEIILYYDARSKKHQITILCLQPSLSYPACKSNALYYILLLACQAITYFSALSHKWNDFRKKVIERKIRVLIFSTTPSEIFDLLTSTQRIITINLHGSKCKLLVINTFTAIVDLSRFNNSCLKSRQLRPYSI